MSIEILENNKSVTDIYLLHGLSSSLTFSDLVTLINFRWKFERCVVNITIPTIKTTS